MLRALLTSRSPIATARRLRKPCSLFHRYPNRVLNISLSDISVFPVTADPSHQLPCPLIPTSGGVAGAPTRATGIAAAAGVTCRVRRGCNGRHARVCGPLAAASRRRLQLLPRRTCRVIAQPVHDCAGGADPPAVLSVFGGGAGRKAEPGAAMQSLQTQPRTLRTQSKAGLRHTKVRAVRHPGLGEVTPASLTCQPPQSLLCACSPCTRLSLRAASSQHPRSLVKAELVRGCCAVLHISLAYQDDSAGSAAQRSFSGVHACCCDGLNARLNSLCRTSSEMRAAPTSRRARSIAAS